MAFRAPFNATSSHTSSSMIAPTRSPWHSPVPYLFGGLAAMLGLIAFALLILACSYWKLSGYLDADDNNNRADIESGTKGDDDLSAPKSPPLMEEKILVIMAGDARPTFLATPASTRTLSFANNGSCVCAVKSDGNKPLEDSSNSNVVVGSDRSLRLQEQ